MAPAIETEGVRRRSLSGASALIARRFTRQTSAPRPVASRSESTTRRRATIASTSTPSTTTATTTTTTNINTSGVKVHVRIVPNIENPSRSLIFDIVDRELQVGSVIRIGRYSERHANLNCMSFKSKVVSRCHSEVWVETDGKLYIRDTKSSSGTFLNHVRLSPAGNESRPVELNDGDIVQLGVDFQGGREEMYRSVKMRFELNRSSRPRPLSFSINAFQNLRNLTHNQQRQQLQLQQQEQEQEQEHENDQCVTTQKDNNVQPTTKIPSKLCTPALNNPTNDDIDECCICLYALAPFQALFVSPCSHTYHFKCIRPLLSSYPGFQCPICRTYSDLEASVAIEADEVMEQYIQHKNTTNAPEADSGLGLQSDRNQPTTTTTIESSIIHPTSCSLIHSAPDDDLDDDNAADSTAIVHTVDNNDNTPPPPLHVTDPYSTTFISSPVIYSETVPDSLPLDQDANDIQHVTEVNNIERPRERRTSHIMEKIKMVFFEKRKSVSQQSNNNNTATMGRRRQKRPLSYPNGEEQGCSRHDQSRTAPVISQTLSRQSTTHSNEYHSRESTIQQSTVHV